MARIIGGTVARGTKRRSGGNGRGRKSKKKLDSPNTLIVLGSRWKDRSWAMPLAGATDYFTKRSGSATLEGRTFC